MEIASSCRQPRGTSGSIFCPEPGSGITEFSGRRDNTIILQNIITLSLNTKSLVSLLGRPSAFNMIGFRGQPTLLGVTFQNGTCTETGCDGNTMYGDNQVLSLDMMREEEQQEWLQV